MVVGVGKLVFFNGMIFGLLIIGRLGFILLLMRFFILCL